MRRGLDQSPITEVLIEESVLGWKEYEMEVMRDLDDNVVIICCIENFDPMGVHTGDSITVAPAQTLTDKEYQRMRDASLAVIREIGVETGGSNIQFAIDPSTGRMIVIEMNPRVSRSSALASKATGFPIAKIAAKLAVGYRLHELPNDITRETQACFEPTIDYVVTKIPRFAFEKFPEADATLDDADEERGRDDGDRPHVQGVVSEGAARSGSRQLRVRLRRQGPVGNGSAAERGRDPGQAGHAERRPGLVSAVRHEGGHVARRDPRPDGHRSLVPGPAVADRGIRGTAAVGTRSGSSWTLPRCARPSRWVFPIGNWPTLFNTQRDGGPRVTAIERGVRATFKSVDTCAAEFEAYTPYYYSTYEDEDETPAKDPDKKRVMILGGGPNRIGQGIEFDYCCCHASFALREMGIESIMVNSNPETVSTDYDTSDLLFFEPLTTEDVLNICDRVQPDGVIVQFGGQTPLNSGPRSGDGRRTDHRHQRRHDRGGRGPREVPAAAGTAEV